ncbi:protein NLP7 isoform X2 [Capsicum annuum]|uniref:protein NLP7 isoform X2 n=1 Tax=Capsicum annuum TaxID=4072 RepID=UPI0007BF43F5|nr:protein NLP7 isoform X2 [Capsicum annuum]
MNDMINNIPFNHSANMMEQIEKNQLAMINDDVYEVYTSSEFMNYIGTPLSCSEERSNFHLMVFWSNNQPQSNCLVEASVKQKIKAALQRIETSQVILLQFWGLENIEGRNFLSTSGQPFGLRYLYKGLCWYRKHCQGYKYSTVDHKGENHEQGTTEKDNLFGPPTRVFQQKLPESSTHVGYYTNEEFPMRDHAVQCGVRTYLALPVFEPIEKNCVGVIELVTVWKGGYLTYEVERVLNPLEGVDLKCPKIYLNKGRKVQAGKQNEREEIKTMLKIVRETHKLPFVRVWIPCVNLEMDHNGMYVGCTEHAISADPTILLGSILSTMGQHFRSFKFASGQELGNDSRVQVVKASSDKNVDYFHIYHLASPFMPEVLQAEEQRNQLTEENKNLTGKEGRQPPMAQSDVLSIDPHIISEKQCVGVTHLRKESRTRNKDSVNYDDLKLHFNKNLSDAAESLQVSRSTLKRLCRKYGIRRWPLSKRKKNTNSDNQALTILPKKNKSTTSEITTSHTDHESSSGNSCFTIKATYGDDMMKFKLYTFSRKDDLDNEVAKRLQLPIGGFRINYMDEDNDRIWIACDDDLRDCFSNAQSLGKNTIKMLVLPAAINHHLEL